MVDTSQALTVLPASGVDSYRMSTDAATITRELVLATALTIQGRKYVRAEGWQAIAIAHGCSASSCHVERVDGGFRAIGQVRRMDTGAVIAEAEGYVGEDEPVWFGGTDSRGKTHTKRPDYAIRAMAQTRAISRACRSAFAHVVVQIDKKLGTTPAEEMEHLDLRGGGGDDWDDIRREAEKDGIAQPEAPSTYQRNKADAAKEKADLLVMDLNNTKWENRDALEAWWDKQNAIPEGKKIGAIDWLQKNAKDQYERVETAYLNAEASTRAAA